MDRLTLTVDEGLELKQVVPEDAEGIFAVVDRNREHLRPWTEWVDRNTEPKHTLEFITGSLERVEKGTGLDLGIWYQGKFVGCVGVAGINAEHRRAEIGYWLDADNQGRGIVTRASRALIDHLVEAWGMHRIELRIDMWNRKSRAVAERLGCKLEGIQRQSQLVGGEFKDMVMYAVLAGELPGSSKMDSGGGDAQ